MARRWIIVGICVVAVAVGGFFLWKGVRGQAKAQQKPPMTAPEKTEGELQRQQLQAAVLGAGGQLKTIEHSPKGWTLGIEVPGTNANLSDTLNDTLLLMSELNRVDAPIEYTTVVHRTDKFKDVWGHELSDVVTARIGLSGDTFSKIDWTGFDQTNFPRIADEFWLHDLLVTQPLAPPEEQRSGSMGGGGGSGGDGGGGGGGDSGGGGGGM